jgi:hypothetical protein
VAGGQKHEVSYEAAKTGAKPAEVRDALTKAGNSRSKVETDLKRHLPHRAGSHEAGPLMDLYHQFVCFPRQWMMVESYAVSNPMRD